MFAHWPRSAVRYALIVGIAACILLAGGVWRWRLAPHASGANPQLTSADPAPPEAPAQDPGIIEFPQPWEAASIKVQPIEEGQFAEAIELTGTISLNEDRLTHIFPLVEGRVADVRVKLGDRVREGDVLVVVESREVGQAMLALFQDRLQRDNVAARDRWLQSVSANTLELIKLIRSQATIASIESDLADRPTGEYRERLMSAYIAAQKTQKHIERLKPLVQQGAVTGKEMVEAEGQFNAARSTLQSLLEQTHQDVQYAAKVSTQNLEELKTRVAVDETSLRILGFSSEALAKIDPVRQGKAIAHYEIRAPFDGKVVTKDVTPLERVSPNAQVLSVADLSTVWVNTNVYEEHLPLLRKLDGQLIEFHSRAWPGKTFRARVFYTGDLIDETSRTVSMRAVADNPDGLLKPGMFVDVTLPSLADDHVLRAPLAAVQAHAGKSFVFVHLGGDRFARRDVRTARRNTEYVEITSGLKAGEKVVVDGGFALKSRMLAELLEE